MKDATAFLNFIEKTKVGKDTILVSMNVSSLYTNIPQEEGTNILCEAYEKLNDHNAPIPTHYLREMLGLIFQRKFVLIQWGELPWPKRKWAMSFANISMAKIETKSIQQCETRPREWKHYIDDVFSLWDWNREEVDSLLNELTISTLQSNSRPKYQRTKPPSSIPQCLKERDSQKIQLGHQNPLQADRDLSIYALRHMPPTRRKT